MKTINARANFVSAIVRTWAARDCYAYGLRWDLFDTELIGRMKITVNELYAAGVMYSFVPGTSDQPLDLDNSFLKPLGFHYRPNIDLFEQSFDDVIHFKILPNGTAAFLIFERPEIQEARRRIIEASAIPISRVKLVEPRPVVPSSNDGADDPFPSPRSPIE